MEFCCVRGQLYKEFRAYHGTLTIDPDNGTILRMMLIADQEKAAQIFDAELMVEYGPVALGENSYFCPLRSISVSRTPGEIERILTSSQAASNEAGEGAPLQTVTERDHILLTFISFAPRAQIPSASSNSGDGSIPNAPANAQSIP